MAKSTVRVRAAEFYAREHGIRVHDAFQDPTFRRMFNDFIKHPHNPTIRKSLGLNKRLKEEGKVAEKSFREITEIRRGYTIEEIAA